MNFISNKSISYAFHQYTPNPKLKLYSEGIDNALQYMVSNKLRDFNVFALQAGCDPEACKRLLERIDEPSIQLCQQLGVFLKIEAASFFIPKKVQPINDRQTATPLPQSDGLKKSKTTNSNSKKPSYTNATYKFHPYLTGKGIAKYSFNIEDFQRIAKHKKPPELRGKIIRKNYYKVKGAQYLKNFFGTTKITKAKIAQALGIRPIELDKLIIGSHIPICTNLLDALCDLVHVSPEEYLEEVSQEYFLALDTVQPASKMNIQFPPLQPDENELQAPENYDAINDQRSLCANMTGDNVENINDIIDPSIVQLIDRYLNDDLDLDTLAASTQKSNANSALSGSKADFSELV